MSADGTIPEARTSASTSSWYTPTRIIISGPCSSIFARLAALLPSPRLDWDDYMPAGGEL